MFRHLLGTYLREEMTLKIVGEADNGQKGLDLCRELKPDLVFLDLRLPVISGQDLAQVLLSEMPTVKIIAISGVYLREAIAELVKIGVHGYVSKQDDFKCIGEAVESVLAGRIYFSLPKNEIRTAAPPLFTHPKLRLLTNREVEVLRILCQGKTNKEIALELGLEAKTIEAHRARICRKLEVTHVAGLVKLALEAGLV